MLYDILPPLLLLFSFSGIIVLITRAMIKVRSVQETAEIQASVMSDTPVHAESVIGPNKGNIHIVKNRLFHAFSLVGQGIIAGMQSARTVSSNIVPTVQAMVSSRKIAMQEKKNQKEIKKEVPGVEAPQPHGVRGVMKGIHLPEISIHEKIEALTEKGKQGFSFLAHAVKKSAPHMQRGISSVRDQIVSSIPVRNVSKKSEATIAPIIRLVHQEPVLEQKRGIMSQMMQRTKEETILEKAERVIGENKFDEAEDILVPHIMKHAGDTKAYMLLGEASMGKGAWEEAMEVFQQVLKINNEESEAQAKLGHCALQAGHFTKAIQALQRARDNDPENISIREDLLFIARRMDNKVMVRGVTEELVALKEKAKA
ncbi:MAG: tetratricopeptide repeat protein [Candidatus Andersenbacteria bacterium]